MYEEIIAEEIHFEEEDLHVSVIVGDIVPKEANSLLRLLSADVPLERVGLNHLKRIRRRKADESDGLSAPSSVLEIILCLERDEIGLNDEIRRFCARTRVVKVCRYEPRTRAEFMDWKERWPWPMVFRPSDIAREREKGLSLETTTRMETFMRSVREDSEAMGRMKDFCFGPEEGAILVNPASNAIIMSASYALQYLVTTKGKDVSIHPLYSPVILVVAGVAAIARGDLSPLAALPRDQYLCTGLELYIAREPDIAGSMALVHSRILSVVFCTVNEESGGLLSLYRLHTLRSINHRFRVYRRI